jgi:mono/diheme cytochrome c family protein
MLASVVWCRAETATTPADLYAQHCAPCHGPDGKSHTPAGRKLRAKDLTATTLSEVQIEAQIRHGTKDSRGIERMPAFDSKLSPAEISAVAAFVRQLKN